MLLRPLLLVSLLSILAAPVRADVWGFVDEKGVPHFAADRQDDRYELFFKSAAGDIFLKAETPPVSASAEEPRRELPGTRTQAKLLAFFEVSPGYKGVRHLMRDAAGLYNLDVELLQAMIATESGFDPRAVSPKGAVGLMQLMPATAERYGVVADSKTPVEKKLTDPQTNIHAGSRYLRYLINLFPGKLELAIAAYNAGEGAVQRAGNTIPKYKETQDYVRTVMQLYNLLKPPQAITEWRRLPANGARTRIELPAAGLPAAVAGGAKGRGNMVVPLASPVTVANNYGDEP